MLNKCINIMIGSIVGSFIFTVIYSFIIDTEIDFRKEWFHIFIVVILGEFVYPKFRKDECH